MKIIKKYSTFLLVLGSILVNIKKIFTDFNVDCEYAIAMSYRLAMGDHMFSQMREPHQTSAFLLAFFIKIWMQTVGTTTGIVLYLNVVSVIIKFLVVVFFYQTLKKYCDHRISLFTAFFLAVVTAKSYILLDFSNMLINSSILLFGCLLRYLQNQNNKKWLLLSALSLCLAVLSYPSFIIAFVIVMAVLLCMSQHRLKDSLIVSSVCGVLGTCYIAFFVIRLGWTQFCTNVQIIISGDLTHSEGIPEKFAGYGAELRELLMLYAVLLLLACLAALLICFIGKRIMQTSPLFGAVWGMSFFTLLLIFHFVCILTANNAFEWVETYFPIMMFGGLLSRYCTAVEKQIYWLGTYLGISSLFAVLLLTNLTFDTAMAYMLLGTAVSFIPISRGLGMVCKHVSLPFVLFCSLEIFRGLYIFSPMTGINDRSLLSVGNIVRSGPAIGIISDYMGPYIMNMDMQEWPYYVHSGDRVLIVGGDAISPLKYLYEDITISVDSTICTPTYNEKLLQYWEENPEKYPDVVVVDCWFGHLNVDEDSWIMQWLCEEFEANAYEDGTYQRYYRKTEQN